MLFLRNEYLLANLLVIKVCPNCYIIFNLMLQFCFAYPLMIANKGITFVMLIGNI